MSLRHYLVYGSDPFVSFLRRTYFRFNNKYYDINNIIKETYIEQDGFAISVLKNGIKIGCFPSLHPKHNKLIDIENGANKNKFQNIKKLPQYHFLYEIIDELFLHTPHFLHFDIESGDTVIDVGANIGGFTLQAALKAGNSGKVYAIEPHPSNVAVLKRNLELNNLTNVEIIPQGLWSEKSTLELQINKLPGQHSLMGQKTNDTKTIEIPVNTFDDLVLQYNMNRIDFIKMDIEGAELEAIKGMKISLQKYSPKMVIEAMHIVDGEPTYKKLIPELEIMNYKIKAFDKYRASIYACK